MTPSMSLDRLIATAFRMDDTAWRRHANPWSVWTRAATLPFLVLAVWGRAWIGWWSLVPIGILVVWLWLNPRIFPSPRSTDNWASKSVLGERVWLNRKQVPLPPHHRLAPLILSFVSLTGAIVLIWGLIALLIWPTLLGTTIVYLGKLWFLDRMVWLYEDMKDARPEYREWLY